MAYELYYWPGLQGRGEFVRLALEEAGASYVDVARLPEGRSGGVKALKNILDAENEPHSPFSPPFLKDGELVVSHVANILLHLGPKLGLAPETAALRSFANGLQLTISDMVAEVHDTHHPISTERYYEDQKAAAKARAGAFIAHRLPKFLGYFERVLAHNPAGADHTVGGALTYVDLSLFQLVEGLTYAFPRAMEPFGRRYRGLAALCEAVRARPHIARYLASPRRIPFNESGVFRHYPELDRPARSPSGGAASRRRRAPMNAAG
jgi:glutathione S-transferase